MSFPSHGQPGATRWGDRIPIEGHNRTTNSGKGTDQLGMGFKRKLALTVFLILGFLSIGVAGVGRFVSYGHRSPEPAAELCGTIARRYYPLRHWSWSGIFPFEGGFIPDPHFLWSDRMVVTEPVKQRLSNEAQYQLVDVNPFFDDYSSEVLLLIKSGNQSFEYTLARPKGRSVQAVTASLMLPSAILFPSGQKLPVLVNFHGVRGGYLLDLPLRSGRQLELTPAGSTNFGTIATTFRAVSQERTTREQVCSRFRRNDFVAFYEKYCGPCEDGARNSAEIENAFARFWLQD